MSVWIIGAPPSPRAVSTWGTGGTADRQDAAAWLRGSRVATAVAHLYAPGATSVAGGAQPQESGRAGA